MRKISGNVVYRLYRFIDDYEDEITESSNFDKTLFVFNDKKYEYFLYNEGIGYLELLDNDFFYFNSFCAYDEITILNNPDDSSFTLSLYGDGLSLITKLPKTIFDFSRPIFIASDKMVFELIFKENSLNPDVVKASFKTLRKKLKLA